MERTVDVIVPVYHPDEKFERLLEMLERQTYDIGRIILMHTVEAGEELKSEKAKSMANVEIHPVKKEEFDHGGTRDKGAKLSNADIMLFMTQDAVPYNDRLVEKLISAFKVREVAAAYARQLPNEDCGIIEKYTRSFNYSEKSSRKSKKDLRRLGIKTYFCSNVCAAYRKDLYGELGGFITNTIFNEDMIFAASVIEAGYEIAYVAEAKVIHSHNYTNKEQFCRNFDLAVSQADHPEIFEDVKSEGEGMKLVKETACYLLRKKKPGLVCSLVLTSAYKYLGYRKGKNYKKLSEKKIMKYTMNPAYWTKKRTSG